MKHLVEEAGRADEFLIDSAGILSYHQGELPEEDIPFEAFPDAAGGDEGESGASHTTEEYVSFEHEP